MDLDPAQRVRTLWRTMADQGQTPLSLLLGGEIAQPHRHYPDGDVYDPSHATQFYYHVHRPGEAGHIHLFQRARGMPARMLTGREADLSGNVPCHLVAISLGVDGNARELFTTNRWVTGETWWEADQVRLLVPRFRMCADGPLGPLAAWLEALVALHAGTIGRLLDDRDARIRAWQDEYPDLDAREDGGLEITSRAPIEVMG